MKEAIRKRLVHAALAITMGAAGVATYQAQQPSAEVQLAMELGAYYESSGRHIGTPYVDRLGKGQPLTVCNGVTGPEVVAGRTYSREDCKRLELPRYLEAERLARAALRHWDSWNVWVRASLIDMVYNLGPSVLVGTTLVRLGNAGDLVGMCEQMPRWVRGTVNGQSVVLPGLQDRRATTRELCAEWGRDGHFSAGLIAEVRP
jgi:lysozyme